MSRIPTPRRVLRRIDRLSRAAHRFHRFAHHPLCGAYAGEVIRVGKRTRLCRGCTLAATGAIAGGALGLLVAPPLLAAVASGLVAVALLPLRHGGKWRSRFAPALGLSFAAAGGLVLAAVAAGIALALVAAYRRRGPDRTPCVACADRAAAPCPGFSPIIRRERAFQRRVRRLLVVT